MPELPEVEIVARSLDELISGRRVSDAALLRPRLAPDTDPAEFKSRLANARVRSVRRRGKHILIHLDNRSTLVIHLRMTGRFMILSPDIDDPKFTHAVFYFDDDARLVFQDQRHFGLMKIVETAKLDEAKELAKLAPEPLSAQFSRDHLLQSLRTSRRSVKEFILDQSKVCGLGNIYASESLFLARVDPRSPANSLSTRKIGRLYESIRNVLREAIDLGSTLSIDPQNISGSIYGRGAKTAWRVYDREDESCPTCGKAIVRIKQGSRSTYFCRRCQRG